MGFHLHCIWIRGCLPKRLYAGSTSDLFLPPSHPVCVCAHLYTSLKNLYTMTFTPIQLSFLVLIETSTTIKNNNNKKITTSTARLISTSNKKCWHRALSDFPTDMFPERSITQEPVHRVFSREPCDAPRKGDALGVRHSRYSKSRSLVWDFSSATFPNHSILGKAGIKPEV